MGGHIGALADGDRRDNRAVGADEAALANDRLVLLPAIVVTGDRAGSDVGPLADYHVTQVSHVAGRHPVFEHGVL